MIWLIKIILIALTYKFIKFIIFFLIFIFLIINKESEDVLKKKENYCLRPIDFYTTAGIDLPLGTFAYYWYFNKVFDLTYIKIMIGREKFWIKIIKSIKLKYLIKRIILWYIDFSYLLLKIIKEIIKFNKNEKFDFYLFNKINKNKLNPDRLIIRIEEKWQINGSYLEICMKCINFLKNKNTISTSNIELLKPRFYNIIKEYSDNLNNNFNNSKNIEQGIFINKINKSMHWYLEGISKDEDKKPYFTDQKNAEKFNYYGIEDQVLMKGIEWKKPSCLIQIPKDNVRLKGIVDKISSIRLFKAADLNGYNEVLIKESIIEDICYFKDEKKKMIIRLKEEGLSEIDSLYLSNIIYDETINNILKLEK